MDFLAEVKFLSNYSSFSQIDATATMTTLETIRKTQGDDGIFIAMRVLQT